MFSVFIKEIFFKGFYCQKCKKISNSKYQDKLYVLPNYLIIILNRGKENIFNCNVQILENFCPSNYVEYEKNTTFNLIGIISNFGESGIEDYFIAFCKHNIDGKWRCYNDSIVTECQNDYLNKGIPYILFYKKEKINNNNSNQLNQFSNNIISNFNNNQFNNAFFYINNSNQLNKHFNNSQQNFNINI